MAADNKRGAVRVQKRIEITYRSNCPPMNGFIEDLGERGIFVDTTQPLPAGSEVEFWFQLPDDKAAETIHGHGRVAWSDRTGMGIHFQRLGYDEQERIRFFVATLFFGHD